MEYEWKSIYVFISSTFNDMHAERDYLVKKVFPRLRKWCAARHLKLLDVDLRWGVREEDATKNKRVVDVCLQNIDKCRPFFLCLLGQRRGWVPGVNDINAHTLDLFPALKKYIGNTSVTEMEIIHALLEPLDDHSEKIRHALLYFRDADYLKDIKDQRVKNVFLPNQDIEELEKFKEFLRNNCRVYDYHGKWDSTAASYELLNINGMDLSGGRLTEFTIENEPLAEHIFERLKEEILLEFPEREERKDHGSSLEEELEKQSTYLFEIKDGYIARENIEKTVMDHLNCDNPKPFILTAQAGAGKSSLLANLISEKIKGNVIYRFVGTSASSGSVDTMLASVYEQFFVLGYIDEKTKEEGIKDPCTVFPEIVNKIKENVTIIFDALDQFGENFDDLTWIPAQLPENIKMIISVKKEEQSKWYEGIMQLDAVFYEMRGMDRREDKAALVNGYLSQFLKNVDEKQLQKIISLAGSDNPLYLKIVLQELRVYGSFDTLMDQLDHDYGSTPKEAFQMVLERLEKEPFIPEMNATDFVSTFLGLLSYSIEKLNAEDLAGIFRYALEGKYNDTCKETILDGIYTLVNHLDAYLIQDGGQVGFLYDSFREAIRQRYQEREQEFYCLLTGLYDFYCQRDGEPGTFFSAKESTIACLAVYALKSHAAGKYFSNPWFLLRMLEKTGVYRTISFYARASETDQVYGEIADIIRKASDRIQICPKVVFYEMEHRHFADETINNMLETVRRTMEGMLIYPSYTNEADLNLAERTIKTVTVSSFGEDIYLSGDHYIKISDVKEGDGVFSHAELEIVRLSDEKLILKKVWDDRIISSSCDGKYLAVCYGGEPKERMIYELPTLRVYKKVVLPPLTEGQIWCQYCYLYDGQVYEFARSPEEDGVSTFSLYCTRDMRLILKLKTGYGSTESFYGPYFFFYGLEGEGNKDRRSLLVYLPTGEVLFDRKNDGSAYDFTYDNGILFASRKRQGQAVIYTRYTETSKEIRQKNGVFDDSIQFGFGRLALCHQYLYLFKGTQYYVFDLDGQYLGNAAIDKSVSEANILRGSDGNRFLYYRQGKIWINLEYELAQYDEAALLTRAIGNFKDEAGSYTVGYCHSIDDRFLFQEYAHSSLLDMSQPAIKQTGEYVKNFNHADILEVGYRRCLARCVFGKGWFLAEYVDAESLETLLRFSEECDEQWLAKRTFFYDFGLAVIFFSTDAIKRQDLDGKSRSYHKMKIVYYRFNGQRTGFEAEKETCFDFLIKNDDCYLIPMGRVCYVAVSEILAEDDHRELRIYKADKTSLESVFCYAYGLSDAFPCSSDSNQCHIDGKYAVLGNRFNAAEFKITKTLLIFDIRTRTLKKYEIETFSRIYIAGGNEKELYLEDVDQNLVMVYSIEENRILLPISTQPYQYQQIARMFGGYLCVNGAGNCRVYDKQDGHLIHQQQLDIDSHIIEVFPKYERLFVQSSGSRFCVFEMKDLSELDQMETKRIAVQNPLDKPSPHS